MLRILQPRLQQYLSRELPDVQGGFRKGRGTRDQIDNSHWITEKARELQKKHLLDYAKAVENSKRHGSTRPLDLPPEEHVCCSKSNSQNQTWDNRLVPNWERCTSRLYIVTLLIELICRVHYEKCWAGWSTIWNQRLLEKRSITTDM